MHDIVPQLIVAVTAIVVAWIGRPRGRRWSFGQCAMKPDPRYTVGDEGQAAGPVDPARGLEEGSRRFDSRPETTEAEAEEADLKDGTNVANGRMHGDRNVIQRQDNVARQDRGRFRNIVEDYIRGEIRLLVCLNVAREHGFVDHNLVVQRRRETLRLQQRDWRGRYLLMSNSTPMMMHEMYGENLLNPEEMQIAWQQVTSLGTAMPTPTDKAALNAAITLFEGCALDAYDIFYVNAMRTAGIDAVVTDDIDFIHVPRSSRLYGQR
jgi:hypothetical protein